MGKTNETKGNHAADTVRSPSPPSYGPERAPVLEQQWPLEQGSRSLERVIPQTSAQALARCLARHEVIAYLGSGCPRDLRARAEAHIAECGACRRWVRHMDDEVLEYVGGEPSDEELTRMDAHLDACSACRELVHHVLQGMAKSWPGGEREVPDSSTTFATGNIVNARYRILSFVGRGGMGEVYEAFDQLMDRRIALKTVLCTAGDRPRAARRFKEEVRNAQRVGHPHVCRINDLQEHQEGVFGAPLPFFTMEFIEGERLGNRLMRGALPIDDVRIIALQLLDGLKAAHARGVLHLDFKSDNVMLRRTENGTPDAVIMDFGLSRVQGHESRLRTTDRRQFAGTLPYMSVEQLECRDELGPATDVYAFGVVLYEMLTKALPFDGESLSAVLLKQLKERPAPPSRIAAGLSPAVDRFVLKCLSSKARARYADAGQALGALESIGSWSRAPMAKRLRRGAPLAALGLLVTVVATAAMRRTTSSPAAPPHESMLAPPLPQMTRALEGAPTDRSRSGEPAAAPASAAPHVSTLSQHEQSAAASSDANGGPPRGALAMPHGAARSIHAVAPTLSTSAKRGGAATAGLSRRIPAVANSPSDETALSGAAERGLAATAGLATSTPPPWGGAGSWKPARVPKRLSVPLPGQSLPSQILPSQTPPSQGAALDQKRP